MHIKWKKINNSVKTTIRIAKYIQYNLTNPNNLINSLIWMDESTPRLKVDLLFKS